MRDRFFETFKASNGEPYDPDAIIRLSPAIEELRELKSELSQVTYTYNQAGKVQVNKAPDGHASPESGGLGDDRVRAGQPRHPDHARRRVDFGG